MRRLLPRQRLAAEVAELRAALDQARAETARLAAELDTVTAERDEARRDCEHLRCRASHLTRQVGELAAERSRLEAAVAARASAPSPTTELLRLRERCARLDADRAELIDLNDQLSRELVDLAGTLAKPHPQPGAAS